MRFVSSEIRFGRQVVRLRITKIDEYQLLTCIKHGVWGSNRSTRFKAWQIGDYLAIIVDKSLAALAEIVDRPYESHEKVWDNGLFKYRIRVKFTHMLRPADRPQILGKLRNALAQEWGPNYGWAILNQQMIEGGNAETVARAITLAPNALVEYQHSLTTQLKEARLRREQASQRLSRRVRPW